MVGRTNVGRPFSLSISGNNAVSFNGSTQFGTLLNYALLNNLTDFTIEYWLYNQGANASKTLLQLKDPLAGSYFYNDGFDGGGTNSSNINTKYSSSNAFIGTTQSNAKVRASNTWEHNALVFNSSSKTLTLYKNGVAVGADFSGIGSGTEQTSNPINLYVGGNSAGASANVRLACIRLWGSIRTATDILTNMNYYLDPLQETGAANLVVNLNFIEGTSSMVAESVTGGTMSLTGSPSWTTGPSLTVKDYNGPRSSAGSRSTAGPRTLAS